MVRFRSMLKRVRDLPVSRVTAKRILKLAGGAMPAVAVATIIPLTIFYSMSAAFSTKVGIIASLTWAYLILGKQLVATRRMSGLLTLTAFTLSIRCVTWAIHQSTFTYFAVPVVETVATGALFVVTLAVGKPLLVSLARDFVPSLGDHLDHAHYRPMVRRLSCLWGAVYLGSAATSATLLVTQNTHWFLLLHQASGWIWTGTGLAISFAYGRRHAHDLLVAATSGLRGEHVVVPAVASAG